MGRAHLISSVLILLWEISLVHPQCNTTVAAHSILLVPTPFRGSLAIFPDGTTCTRDPNTVLITCGTPNSLTDGLVGPNQPDIDSDDDRMFFVAWNILNIKPYLSISFSNISAVISSLDLHMLNYPAEGIGLPNLELYGTSNISEINPPPESAVEFDLVGNQQLSQTDSTVRKLTLRLRTPRTFIAIHLRWTFTGLLSNMEWFAISEILLCADESLVSPVYNTSFLIPEEHTTTIVPRTQFLSDTSLILTCNMSIQGSFEWRWRKESVDIEKSTTTTLFTADGTRTSILNISQVNFSIAGTYFCEAKPSGLNATYSRQFDIGFPKTIEAKSIVKAFLGIQQSVTFSCEAHGYFSNPVLLKWMKEGSNEELTNSSKYSIAYGVGTNELVFSDHVLAMSSVCFLTIMQLSEDDTGNYTCSVDGTQLEFTTSVLTMGGTASPSTGATMVISVMMLDRGDENQGLVIGITIPSIIIVVVILPIIIVIIVLLHMKQRSMQKAGNPQHILSETNQTDNQIELQQHSTKDGNNWMIANEENSMYERNGIHTYDTGGKGGMENLYASLEREEIPSSPSQLKASSDVVQLGTIYDDIKPVNIYDEAMLSRRMTNSSLPTLAKLRTPESLGLSMNPIYESTENSSLPHARVDQQHLRSSLIETDDTVLYALPTINIPTKPTAEQTLDQNSEPVYSEALTPAMFHQTVQTTDNPLHPYGPIYAQPTMTDPSNTCVKEVTNSNFRELRHLGVGQFGEVVLAETVGLSRSDLNLPTPDTDRGVFIQVAIKKLKRGVETSIHQTFNKEIKFMSGLKNDNIIRLLAVGRGLEPFIIMEYMENGDLNQLLNGYDAITYNNSTVQVQGAERNIDVSSLVYASLQVASGMKYLASHNYVHRDLATRNCLVGKNFIVKIGDFGMSRSLYGCSYYVVRGHAMLPIRWMATDSFYGKFSEKTDVWSFGITMWEIFTLCRRLPYEDVPDQDFIKDAIKGDERCLLENPTMCPEVVYRVMLRCWEYKCHERAGFDEVHKMLSMIHQDISRGVFQCSQ